MWIELEQFLRSGSVPVMKAMIQENIYTSSVWYIVSGALECMMCDWFWHFIILMAYIIPPIFLCKFTHTWFMACLKIVCLLCFNKQYQLDGNIKMDEKVLVCVRKKEGENIRICGFNLWFMSEYINSNMEEMRTLCRLPECIFCQKNFFFLLPFFQMLCLPQFCPLLLSNLLDLGIIIHSIFHFLLNRGEGEAIINLLMT